MSLDFLTMKNISKNYAGVRALDAIDFSIAKGEIHCLAGTNGSGKSTLIKIISGVEKPEPGAFIAIKDKPCGTFSAIDSIKEGSRFIYQDLSLFPNLSVAENIAASTMVSEKRKVFSMKSYDAIARAAMERVGIDLPLSSLVGRLSISEQQLVAICRALTSEIKLLIMDEPTTSLTKKEVDRLLAVVTDLKAGGISTLFVSHKLQEVMKVADRVTVLRDGAKIGCFPASAMDSEKLEFHMTGTNFRYSGKSKAPAREKPCSRWGLFEEGEIKGCLRRGHIPAKFGITVCWGGATDSLSRFFGMNVSEDRFPEHRPERARLARSAMQSGRGSPMSPKIAWSRDCSCRRASRRPPWRPSSTASRGVSV